MILYHGSKEIAEGLLPSFAPRYTLIFIFSLFSKMGNSNWNCPFIVLIMQFFLTYTDFCIKGCNFDVNRCFSFLSNEVCPVYLVKRYIFTSRRLTSPCVFRLMSVFASAHRRKAQFSHLNRASHLQEYGCQPSEGEASPRPLPHG